MIIKKIIYIIGFMLLPLFGCSAEYNFRLHYFLPDSSVVHTRFLQPWVDRVEEQSNERINIEIYPAMSLGGKPTELVDQVADGYVDIVWTLAGYTPGRFPRSEAFGLPTVHYRSAYATNRAIYASMDLIAEDFAGLKPLVIHVHAGNAFHLNRSDVKNPADLAGLRVRSPSRTASWMLDTFGAKVVQLPAPAIKNALLANEIDGTLLPFEILPSIGLDEMGLYSVFGKDGSRFGTSVFLFLMNENAFSSLPEDLQAVIDDNIGLEEYKSVGLIWDEFEIPGYEAQRGRFVKLSLDEMVVFEKLGNQIVSRWVDEMDRKGIDGQALVDEARRYVRRYSRIITSVGSNL